MRIRESKQQCFIKETRMWVNIQRSEWKKRMTVRTSPAPANIKMQFS